jgi:hypothetical protein
MEIVTEVRMSLGFSQQSERKEMMSMGLSNMALCEKHQPLRQGWRLQSQSVSVQISQLDIRGGREYVQDGPSDAADFGDKAAQILGISVRD